MNYPRELTETYEIYETIGEGGGGIVYRAAHRRLKKAVVLKKIKVTGSGIQQFRTEVDILKNLRHSYLPQVIDFIESEDGIYTVMDFIPGKSLQRMLEENHKFTEKEVLKYAEQICEALAYLHKQNPPIVHGDIKPANVMITPEGNVCLIDFNISGVLEGQGTKTMGCTPGFSSPEQIFAFKEMRRRILQQKQEGDKLPETQEAEEKTVALWSDTANLIKPSEEQNAGDITEKMRKSVYIDVRSDVFALGATLYRILVGKQFETSNNTIEIAGVSAGCLLMLSKALEWSPENRYADAEEMLQAIQSVKEKDKRYRRLLLRQELSIVAILLMLAVSVYLVAEGKRVIKIEQEQKYTSLVGVLEEAVESGSFPEEFNECYEEAIKIYSQDVFPYYAKGYYLYKCEGVLSALRYLEEVQSLTLTGSEEAFGNLYYLYAECNFMVEAYGEACWGYEKAITYYPDNPLMYRDYAIALVYSERVEEAEKLLVEAVARGMAQTDVNMVRGEIAHMRGEYDEAIDCFRKVTEAAEEEYLLQRAYILLDKVCMKIGTEVALSEGIRWLEEGVARVSSEDRMLLYEALVQEYMRMGEMTEQPGYYQEAIAILEEIVKKNWDSYITYSNIVVLYQRLENYVAAAESAQRMVEAYPEHYVSFMRLAFTELDTQKNREEAEKDYTQFVAYFNKAKEYAKKQLSGNVTDNEMLLLENAYRQLVAGNWIAE